MATVTDHKAFALAYIEYLLQADPASVADYDERLVTQLLQKLDEDRLLISPRTGWTRSTLIVMRPRRAEEAGAWQERLCVAGFDVAVREGNLRISPHLHNSHEDIAKLVGVLST